MVTSFPILPIFAFNLFHRIHVSSAHGITPATTVSINNQHLSIYLSFSLSAPMKTSLVLLDHVTYFKFYLSLDLPRIPSSSGHLQIQFTFTADQADSYWQQETCWACPSLPSHLLLMTLDIIALFPARDIGLIRSITALNWSEMNNKMI